MRWKPVPLYGRSTNCSLSSHVPSSSLFQNTSHCGLSFSWINRLTNPSDLVASESYLTTTGIPVSRSKSRRTPSAKTASWAQYTTNGPAPDCGQNRMGESTASARRTTETHRLRARQGPRLTPNDTSPSPKNQRVTSRRLTSRSLADEAGNPELAKRRTKSGQKDKRDRKITMTDMHSDSGTGS